MRGTSEGEGDRTVVELRDPFVGTVLDDRFHIEQQLAAGGFGAIYSATDVRSDAKVALKVLLPRLARDPMVVARFRREGKTLASLRDPHTITAYELGQAPDGTMYIVMELLHGESLYTRFRAGGRMPWRRVLHIAQGVCSSLAEAHALGVVHRDLKPANIHLEDRDGDPDFVKVLDFGIAKIVQGTDLDRTQLTQAGQMIGTIDYMSPEQMVGGELTPCSDIYTLGVVIYEMISGRTPFADAQSATAILAAVLTRAPEPLSSHVSVPPALDQILERCLERDPARRYGDVADLAAALARVVGDAPVQWNAVVPETGFETVHTTEATRINVRMTDSSEPVLDARGPRRRLPDGVIAPPGPPTPPPVTPPGTPPPETARAAAAAVSRRARGSQGAIGVQDISTPRGAQPTPLPHPTPRGAQPTPPPQQVRRAQPTPPPPEPSPHRAQPTPPSPQQLVRRAQPTPPPPGWPVPGASPVAAGTMPPPGWPPPMGAGAPSQANWPPMGAGAPPQANWPPPMGAAPPPAGWPPVQQPPPAMGMPPAAMQPPPAGWPPSAMQPPGAMASSPGMGLPPGAMSSSPGMALPPGTVQMPAVGLPPGAMSPSPGMAMPPAAPIHPEPAHTSAFVIPDVLPAAHERRRAFPIEPTAGGDTYAAPSPPPHVLPPEPAQTSAFVIPDVLPPPQDRRRAFPIEPTVGSQTYTAPSYDMTAATRHDKLARSIIWIALLIAITAAVLIATH